MYRRLEENKELYIVRLEMYCDDEKNQYVIQSDTRTLEDATRLILTGLAREHKRMWNTDDLESAKIVAEVAQRFYEKMKEKSEE